MNDKFSNWEQEFERNYSVEKFQEISHYWWQDCYNQIEEVVLKNILLDNHSKILECGSGSGNSSLRLANRVKKVVLLDGSKNALKCSRQLSKHYKADNIKFVEGDIFHLPFNDKSYDFCWNIGVIEHYDLIKAKEAVKEMLRVTKNFGYVCIGIPNFASLATIKARVLSFRILNPLTFWIKGYRLSDEKKYDIKILNKLLLTASKESGVKLKRISFEYAGSVLPVETPHYIFRKINRFCNYIFRKSSFLILVIVKIDR